MTLAALLERAALRHPGADAVVDGGRRLTYGELHARARTLGDAFRILGVGRGDRVLIALKNRLEHALAYWALQTIAAVPAPVNFRLASGELKYVLDDSGARVALFERATASAVVEAAGGRDLPLVFAGPDAPDGSIAFDRLVGGGQGRRPLPRTDPAEQDLSLLLYTSGTTGRPKGVPRTHKNHCAGALAHALQCGYAWGERTLGVMPLYHTMGIHSLTSMAAVNGCFVCQPDWSPASALALIAAERLSALYLIPTLYYDLVHAPELPRTDVSSVRKLAYAGAPMLAPLTEACARVFHPRAFVNHYGSTEIYTFSIRPDVHEKPGCAGRPGLNGALRVVAASTERRVGPDELAPPGEKGEIIASLDSDEAFAGYWNHPDADARALRDGWYFTGDMGWVDADGELWVAGRVDDMIISGGENIHPVEVEDVLARHPGVRDVAVIGEPDPRWGERVVAFVVPAAAGLSAETLDAHCRAAADFADFKRPRRIVFVTEIPKTASGKILRRLLRDGQYAEIKA
ncbi:MAG: class I adenylate-forming enzyme family protein [Candidatus Rokuibacteriota bacterium]